MSEVELSEKVSAPVFGDLTEKQERFARLVSEGQNYSRAYRHAYNTSSMSDTSVWREAHRLSRHAGVSKRVAELVDHRIQEADLHAATRRSRVIALLEEMMRTAQTDTARLRAAELLGKTIGLFSDQKTPAPKESLADLEAKLLRLIDSNRATVG